MIEEVSHSPGGKIINEKIPGWRSSIRQAFSMRMGARALAGGSYQEMKLDCALARHKVGPREEALAHRHVGGVQDFDPLAAGLPGKLSLQPGPQLEIGLCKVPGGALLVGVGQGGALHRGETQVIELRLVAPRRMKLTVCLSAGEN